MAEQQAVGQRILVVGGGAREHALGERLRAEGYRLLFAPGNAGTADVGSNVAVRGDDVPALVALAQEEQVALVVVGPELPLTLGLVDALQERGIPAFGPGRAAARLEGSKAYMKNFLQRHGIPTADFRVFDDPDAADAYVRDAARPLVVKADGLAAGKGVVVATCTEEALAAIDTMMRKKAFGDAAAQVVIEEFLPGEEASFHVVSDGTHFVAMAPAQDHKRVGEGDAGPNTGGMGAYAPAPVVTAEVHAKVLRTIVEPTLRGMAAEGHPFRGVLFVGLMIDGGTPRVLEFNVRFGDPETCVLVPLYQGNFGELLQGAANGDLERVLGEGNTGHDRPSAAPSAALCVVMAAEGYPASPRTGDAIEGLDKNVPEGAFVCHAGSRRGPQGEVLTAGGRVLTVGASGTTLAQAAQRAYAAVEQIHWRGEHHRRDIGHRALGSLAPLSPSSSSRTTHG